MIDFGLRAKRTLVVGAGQGIGRACVLALHAAGAHVGCLDSDAVHRQQISLTAKVARVYARRIGAASHMGCAARAQRKSGLRRGLIAAIAPRDHGGTVNHTTKLEQRDGIATLYLDRPPVNAVDTELIRGLAEVLSQIGAAGDVRALVVTGAGTCFSAGLDLKAVPHYTPAEQRDMLNTLNRTIGRLYSLPIPTVAAVNGHAIAGGLVLALACDYRVGPTTGPCQLGLTEARAGIPFPAAAMAIVQAELAPAVARRTTLVARNVGPDAALASGILDELQPPDQVLSRAHAVAHELGAIPRTAYERIKRQLRAPAIAHIERTLSAGNDPMLESWLSPETQAAASSLLAGERKP